MNLYYYNDLIMPHGRHPRLPRPTECGVCATGGTSTPSPRTVSQQASPIFVPFIPPSFQGKMGASSDVLAPHGFRPI
jgi:hypothetical protein